VTTEARCSTCLQWGAWRTPRCPHCGAALMLPARTNPWVSPDGVVWTDVDETVDELPLEQRERVMRRLSPRELELVRRRDAIELADAAE
jgi:hypothetical protein